MVKAPGRHFAACKKSSRWVKLIAAFLAVTLISGSTCAAYFYVRLSTNVTTVDIGEKEVIDIDHDPIQILVLGTDTRTGNGNRDYGSEFDSSGNGNSDVMMLLQLSGDRQHVSVISFPRDLMITIPACQDPQTGEIKPEESSAMLNSALAKGGASCTVSAVNKMTGLKVDHFMMADFNAVKELTKAIGGVEVCVDQSINDPKSGLNIPRGKSNLEGEQALAFLRTRYGFGDGSDIGRIKAQQAFLASMTRKVIEQNLLNDIPKLLMLADIMTKNLTVDKELKSPQEMLTVAEQFRNVNAKEVKFITVPNEPWTQDSNRLQLKEPEAQKIFKNLQQDERRLEVSPTQEPSSAGRSSSQKGASTAPAQNTVPIKIVNSSGAHDEGVKVLVSSLTYLGYGQVSTVTSVVTAAESQIFYSDAYRAEAEDIAKQLGISSERLVASENLTGIQVVVGQDSLNSLNLDIPSLGEIEGQNADEVVCQQGFLGL